MQKPDIYFTGLLCLLQYLSLHFLITFSDSFLIKFSDKTACQYYASLKTGLLHITTRYAAVPFFPKRLFLRAELYSALFTYCLNVYQLLKCSIPFKCSIPSDK